MASTWTVKIRHAKPPAKFRRKHRIKFRSKKWPEKYNFENSAEDPTGIIPSFPCGFLKKGV